MPKALRVLLVEDSKYDAELIIQHLRQCGYAPAFERVETSAAMRAALASGVWDLVLADFSLPAFSGPAALDLYRQMGLDLPFICVSGTIGEQAAVEMMRNGAHDYVMKDDLARLAPAVERELHAAEVRGKRRQAEAEAILLAALVESSDDAIIGKTLEGTVLSWNRGAERLYGYSTTEMLGQPISRLIPPQQPDELPGILDKLRQGQRIERLETVRLRKDGRTVDVSLTLSPIRDADGRILGASSIERDISLRKRQEAERLQLIEDLTRALASVKTLSGLLPICASCKKIRDDRGYWQQVETYVAEHSLANFTHGLCPDCVKRLYPEAERVTDTVGTAKAKAA